MCQGPAYAIDFYNLVEGSSTYHICDPNKTSKNIIKHFPQEDIVHTQKSFKENGPLWNGSREPLEN